MNKVSVVIGIVAIAVIIFLGYMVFNQQQQINDLSNSIDETKLQSEEELGKLEKRRESDLRNQYNQRQQDIRDRKEQERLDYIRKQNCKLYPDSPMYCY